MVRSEAGRGVLPVGLALSSLPHPSPDAASPSLSGLLTAT